MRVLRTAAEVIDALGGNGEVKKLAARKSDQVVSNWRRFNRFPPNTYYAMQKALGEKQYEARPSLWGMVNAP